MKIYRGNQSSLRVILLLIISNEHVTVEGDTIKREKRSFYQQPEIFKPADPFFDGRHFDRPRATSFLNSNLGRLENNNPQFSHRPRDFANFDFKHHGSFRSQKHFQISPITQEIPNHFLNQPVNPQINPNFHSFDHRFMTNNKPHTNLHNSDIFPPIKTSNEPDSRFPQHSRPFSPFNTRPENTKEHTNSQFTVQSPHINQNLDFSRPNSRPVDFSRPNNSPVDFSRPNNRPMDFSRPNNRPFDFSRPNNRPVDFPSILDASVSSAVNLPESNDDGTGNRHTRHFNRPSGPGCSTPSGFRRAGEVWFSSGCRRSKCIAFRGHSSIETDQCDTNIFNTVYQCVIEVNIKAHFPGCCPRYRCNPDNLGNLVD